MFRGGNCTVIQKLIGWVKINLGSGEVQREREEAKHMVEVTVGE